MVQAFILALTVVFALCAAEWTQWRGPNRDGVLAGPARPAWPENLKQKWQLEVGEGYSSPIYGSGRIYQFARQKGREVLRAIDPASGNLLWTQSYPAPYQVNPVAARHGEGPKSTPVYDGGSVYTLGISGVVSDWDASSGKLRWRKEFSKEYRVTTPRCGAAMSPLVAGGLLIAHVGGNDDGALTAFDTATGEVKWTWKGDGPGYASPVVGEFGGVKQVITESQKNVVGVSLGSGELLWRIPFSTSYTQNAVTPLILDGTVIYSGLNNGITAVRVIRQGNAWSAERIWHADGASMYMNSLVPAGGLLYGFSHRRRGQYFCLDPKTGDLVWTGWPRQGDNAAIAAAYGVLYLLNNDAELVIARPGTKGPEVLRRYQAAESATWAHPLPLDHAVIIKDFAHLTAWSLE